MFGAGNVRSVEKLPLIDSVTPYNVKLSAFYKRSFAYFTVKERLPVIITKVIDHLTRDRDAIIQEFGESAREDVKTVIGYLAKLKNEIQTNKPLAPIAVESDDTAEWNQLVREVDDPFYFTCEWLFTECYVYRRIREAFQLTSLINMDPFRDVKDSSFTHSMMAMCIAANHATKLIVAQGVVNVAHTSIEDFQLMLRLNLWANKCDLSLSVGTEVSQDMNPITMVDAFAANIIADDSEKIFHDLQQFVAEKEGKETIIDIVCDNSGYELYMDFCFADFLVTRRFATHIRFHLKSIPWFVSDATPRDLLWVIDSCCKASFSMDLTSQDGGQTKQTLNAQNLNYLGKRWNGYVNSGVWTFKADHFWTTPHEYYKMRDLDKNLYNQLGEAVMVFFKGDLNYRKLMGEVNWPPTTPFEKAIREFFPCPLVAVRTVKADLISGILPGMQEELNKRDEKWMEKGDYGVIQYSPRKIVLAHEEFRASST